MRSAGTILLLLLLSLTAGATAAYPEPVTVRQPDGSTMLLIMHGDEFCRWTTDVWGHPMAQGADGYWHSAPSPSPILLSALRQYNLDRMLPPGSVQTSPLTKGGDTPPVDIKVLVIPVQFQDISFGKTDYREYLDRKLNEPGYSEHGAPGSAKDYFEANFIGSTFTFDVSEVVTLTQEASFYGYNDESVPSRIIYDANMPQLVEESCNILDPTINFQDYDQDGDGKIDHLIFVYAGYNEAEGGGSDAIWSHEWDLTNKKLKYDKIQIGLYAAAAELRGASGDIDAGIGTFCHELSHTFGIKDLYDVNYGNDGLCPSLWRTLSLMDYGNFNNDGLTPPYYCAIEREQAGTADIRYIEENTEVNLEPVNKSGTFYRLDTEKKNEYFLFEVRDEAGWDSHIGGHGLVVYHIDKSDRYVSGIQASVRWSENLINTISGHECADLVEAFQGAESVRQVFFPGQSSVTEFGPMTIPALESWDGESLMLRLEKITRNGENVTFDVVRDSSERLLSVINLTAIPFQTEADIKWRSEKDHARWGVRWKAINAPESEYSEEQTQRMAYRISGLEANTEYEAEVFHIGRTGNGDTTSVIFSTHGFTSIYPSITPERSIFHKGEMIIMKVQNIQEPFESVVWYINNLRVESDSVVLEESGEFILKAVIRYTSDHSSETITKTITVREQ